MTKLDEIKAEIAKIPSIALLLTGAFCGYDPETEDYIDELWSEEDVPETLKYKVLVEPPLYEDAPAEWVYHFTHYDIIVQFKAGYYSSYYDSEWDQDISIREVFPKPVLKIEYVTSKELETPDKALEDYVAGRVNTSGYSTWS